MWTGVTGGGWTAPTVRAGVSTGVCGWAGTDVGGLYEEITVAYMGEIKQILGGKYFIKKARHVHYHQASFTYVNKITSDKISKKEPIATVLHLYC